MIEDSFGRVHDYLRISLTDNCNFRCFYCMPEEEYEFTSSANLMQPQEIYRLAETFVRLGVKKIRLTGGEPLIRKDAAEIILLLSRLPVQLTITTNGARVHEFLPVFQQAGITSINVSLDTLQAEKFNLITRRNIFQKVYDNIGLLIKQGIYVKVNAVIMKGLNDNEINDFVEWTKNDPVHVRFIEFMPFEGNRWASNKVFTLKEILQEVDTRYSFLPLRNTKNDTAKGYIVPGHAGTFSVISTMSVPFCSTCNRMRLTADGKLKNCLFSKDEYDLLGPLRNGEDIIPVIHTAIFKKAKETGGQFSNEFEKLQTENIHNRSMIRIGG